MIKVNVEKELDAKRKQSIDGNQIVDSAKLLLAGDHARERDLLKKIGLGHQIIKAETHHGINIERESIENKFEGKAFTLDEIKSLCLDYNLRFLHTQWFKGSIDLEIGVKIRHFFEKNKLNDGYSGDQNNFHIMAPAKAFNLEDRPKPLKNIDPVLFYRPNGGDKYLLVHKWGNEFTVARLIGGMMRRSEAVNIMFVFCFATCLFNFICAAFGSYSPILDFCISLPIAIAFTLIWHGCDTDRGAKFGRKFNDNMWNSHYKD